MYVVAQLAPVHVNSSLNAHRTTKIDGASLVVTNCVYNRDFAICHGESFDEEKLPRELTRLSTVQACRDCCFAVHPEHMRK